MNNYLWGIFTGFFLLFIPISACGYYYAKHPGKFMRQLIRQANKRPEKKKAA